jgi:DNA-binding PadR family transcriptional regulator
MYAEILILAMLRQRPQHGYELKKSIDLVLGGTVSLNNTVLYPALKRFEEMGAVVRQVVQQEGKPNRHIYHLTERGVELLQAYLNDFGPDLAADEAEFLTRVAFFDVLDLEEQGEILHKRMAYVEAGLAHLRHMQQMADKACTPAQQRVLAFHIQQMHHEYQWIATWLEELQANT